MADLRGESMLFENKCYMSMHGISCREHKINEYVWQVNILARRQELLLSVVASIMVRPCLSS